MKKFQMYINEKSDDVINYINFVFTQGYFIFDNDNYFSWQFFKNYSEDGDYEIYTKKDGVVFQFIQGVPVISVPSKKEGYNIIVNDIFEFYNSDDYKLLSKFIKTNYNYKLI